MNLDPAPGTVAAVFVALAEPSRRQVIGVLAARGVATATSIAEDLAITRQAVTKHLVVLEEANLVAIIWQGREKLHYLNPMPIHEIAERWIGEYERGRLRALAELKKKLEEETDGQV